MRVVVDTIVRAPAETVFAIMTDLARLPERVSGVERIELLTPGPVAVGTRFRETRKMFGRSATEEMTVAAMEPPRRLVFTAHSSGTDYVAVHSFEPVEGGCRVTVDFEGRPASLAGRLASIVMLPFVGKLRQMLQQDLDEIARAAEAEAAGKA